MCCKIDVRDTVIECLNNMGVIVDKETLAESDVNLTEYDLDSLTFVSFIVDIEEKLRIIIPEEYLSFDVLCSLKGFVSLINQVVIDQHN